MTQLKITYFQLCHVSGHEMRWPRTVFLSPWCCGNLLMWCIFKMAHYSCLICAVLRIPESESWADCKKHKEEGVVCVCWLGEGGCSIDVWWCFGVCWMEQMLWSSLETLLLAPSKALPLVTDIWAGMASLKLHRLIFTSLIVKVCSNRKHIPTLTNLNPWQELPKVRASQICLHFPQMSSLP